MRKKNNNKISILISFFYSYFSIFSLSISILLIVLWPEIASTIFWNKFKFSWELLTIGQIFLVFNILSRFNFWYLGGMGKVQERVKIMCISTFLLFTFSIPFLIFGWIYWAVLSFWIWYLLIFLSSYAVIKKQGIKVNLDWEFIIKNIITFTILWLGILTSKEKLSLLSGNRWINIGEIIGIWILFYTILWFINYKKIISLYKEIIQIRN